MRSLYLAPFAALALASCASIPDSGTITTVQQITTAACAYLPTVNTILQIIGTRAAALQTPVQIAQAICLAVVGAGTPTYVVNGVVVEGKFVR